MNICNPFDGDESVWLAYAARDYENDLLTLDCWPWSNVTKDQWLTQAPKFRSLILLLDYVQPLMLVIAPLGLLGSLCSVLAVWRRAITKKEPFFIWMLLIGLADLLFCASYIPVLLGYYDGKVVDNVYKYSYWGTVIASILPGFTSGFSLASDLCILALTIERYIGVCKPAYSASQNGTRWRLFGCFVITVISTVRIVRYAIEFSTVPVPKDENDTSAVQYTTEEVTWITRTPAYTGLVFFSEVVLPFLLLIFMIYLSARIACATSTRNQARIHAIMDSGKRQEKQDQTTSIVRLLVILVVLYLLCQLGNCFYAMRHIVQQVTSIYFSSTYDQMRAYVTGKMYISLSIFISYMVECLSRSANFYLYYWLSASIREEFKSICGGGQRRRGRSETVTRMTPGSTMKSSSLASSPYLVKK